MTTSTLRRGAASAVALLALVLPATASASPTYRYDVANPAGAYVGNGVSGYVLGYLFMANAAPNVKTTAAVDVQRTARSDREKRDYGYGRIVHSDFGHWSAGNRCGWVRMDDLGPRGRQVSPRNVCREPSRRSNGGRLAEKFIFAGGTYVNGCGSGCAQPAVVKSCPNNSVYSNYDPREGARGFHQRQGSEAPGRGRAGYPGVTTPVPGFGTRYRTKNGQAILIKDSSAPGPVWKFIRPNCISGAKTGP